MSYKDRFLFNLHIPTKIVFGEGVLKETVKEMDGLGIRQALVVTNVTLKDSAMVNSLLDTLGGRCAALFPEAIPDSSLQVVGRGGQGLPGEESLEEVAKLAVADMAMRSNIRKVTDPQEIVPVLMAAW